VTVADVSVKLERLDDGPISYSMPEGELVVGILALGRKPFGYPWPDNKWCVYFRTKRESYDVLLFNSEAEACENFLGKVLRDDGLRKRYGAMNKADLEIELNRSEIDPRSYSLDGMDCGDLYVLDENPVGTWTVSFSERGSRREVAAFASESEACLHLLDRCLTAKERWEKHRAAGCS
jgi:hypothetical protein